MAFPETVLSRREIQRAIAQQHADEAIHLMLDRGMTIREAASHLHLPKTTLHRWLSQYITHQHPLYHRMRALLRDHKEVRS